MNPKKVFIKRSFFLLLFVGSIFSFAENFASENKDDDVILIPKRILVPVKRSEAERIFNQFVKEHGPSASLKAFLDKADAEGKLNTLNPVIAFPLQCGKETFYIKHDFPFDRIINCERMQRCIKENGLTHLGVAQKYLYKKLNGNWIAVCCAVKGKEDTILASKEIKKIVAKQLCVLCLETGFFDFNPGNFIWNEQTGKFICIDTENHSFRPDSQFIWHSRKEILIYFLKEKIGSDIAHHVVNDLNKAHQEDALPDCSKYQNRDDSILKGFIEIFARKDLMYSLKLKSNL